MAVAIIQARMSSTRLPGKVLLPLGHGTALECMIERVSAAETVRQVWLATSDDPSDDPLADLAEQLGIPVLRGSLTDVLSRFAAVVRSTRSEDDVWVRLTADCPLICPEIIDATVSALVEQGAEYMSNSIEPSYPRGLDVEAFTTAAILRADESATAAFDREHVTTWLIRNSPPVERFPRLTPPRRNWRLTIDHPEDYHVVAAVHSGLASDGNQFTCEALMAFLDTHPELAEINAQHEAAQVSDRYVPEAGAT